MVLSQKMFPLALGDGHRKATVGLGPPAVISPLREKCPFGSEAKKKGPERRGRKVLLTKVVVMLDLAIFQASILVTRANNLQVLLKLV